MTRVEIESLFPEVFQRTISPGTPLSALIDGVTALHQPAEDVLRRLDSFFDPRRCPGRFVPFLATWADLTPILPVTTGVGCLRQLITLSAQLAQERGSARGLILFLETATGVPGFTIDEQGPPPFHIRICAPEITLPHRAFIERIVEAEKPAHLTYELSFAGKTPRP